jgi:hypothetical protein
VIGSDFPRHIAGGLSCTPYIERLVRTKKSIRAGFIIVTFDKRVIDGSGLVGRTISKPVTVCRKPSEAAQAANLLPVVERCFTDELAKYPAIDSSF